MKPEQYLHEVFKLPQEEVLIEDFQCWIDAITHPAHMYLTKDHLCIHVHGHYTFKEKVILWNDIVELEKRNTAKIIPNGISITLRDGTELHFTFINRHHCFKSLHKLWENRKRSESSIDEYPHVHPNTLSPINPGYDRDELLSSEASVAPEIMKQPKVLSIEKSVGGIKIITDHPIDNDYELQKFLGSGAFSIVRLAENKKTKQKVAVKIVDKDRIAPDKKGMLDREVDILRKIQHKNIIAVIGVYETVKYLYLVMELATGGELFDEIVKRGHYNEEDAAKIIKQVAGAISYLHDKGIVHRDLKPENLLLSDNSPNAIVKIADFGERFQRVFTEISGLSKIMEASMVLQTTCGTPGYVAPEVLLSQGYHQQVDLWSIGVILYVLLSGFQPFYAQSNAHLFEKILAGKYSFPSPYWDKVSDEAKDLIKHLLVVDPDQRYNIDQVLAHPWVTGLNRSQNDLSSVLLELKKTQSQEKVNILVSTGVARMALSEVKE